MVEHRKAEKKVQKKAQKAEAFEGQRHALMKELEETRLEIAQHEAFLKVTFSSIANAYAPVLLGCK